MGNMKSKIFLAILTLICLNKTSEINSKITKIEGSDTPSGIWNAALAKDQVEY